jgi:hypothetical protein
MQRRYPEPKPYFIINVCKYRKRMGADKRWDDCHHEISSNEDPLNLFLTAKHTEKLESTQRF